MKIKYKVIKLNILAFPLAVLVLSTAAFMPMANAKKADANAVKTVYFTFDDGPSPMTDEILDILAEEGIKATFFVIGPPNDKTEERLFRIASEGHAIGLHTMSHDYKKIYSDTGNFINDLEAEKEWIFSVTGVDCEIFRFPGGSSNSSVEEWFIDEIIEETVEMGMRWYDWNADGRDSLGKLLPAEEIAENVLSSKFIESNEVIVLLHDSATRTTTPEALRILIKEFRERGYVFGKLS